MDKKELEAERRALLDSLPILVWYMRDEETYGEANKNFLNFWGFSEDVAGRKLDEILTPELAKYSRFSNRKAIRDKKVVEHKVWVTDGYKRKRFLHVFRTPKMNKKGDVEYVICSAVDNTGIQKKNEELFRQNKYDPLTGLYNRQYFEIQKKKLADTERGSITIFCFDVDGLKEINDNCGHLQGDELLRAAAEFLRDCFREDDLLFRVGGDEFCVLLLGCNQKRGREIERRIEKRLSEYKGELPLKLSFGWSTDERGSEDDICKIFQKADANMYFQKKIKKKLRC